jgi:formylglycine-generating enzyme required for sulfatase activity
VTEGNDVYTSYYHSHPAYRHYPVVNISYEGAQLFCEWLTEKYNSSSSRKFNKVVFQLPTEEQWEKAASGGNQTVIYPWSSNELKDKKGNFFANFSHSSNNNKGVLDETNNPDIINPVKSNKKNKYGIYNMGGNVAEMLVRKGTTKGGSWADEAEKLKIKNTETLNENMLPSPKIGFRIFMKIEQK